MKVLNKLDSLDNINDGETRKLPTKTSQLTNDSGYITSADVPTKTSELTNDNYFNYSIQATKGTIDDLAAFTSGKPGLTGSIDLTKKSSGVGSEIPAGWYNYYFSPHRNGSSDSSDSASYGTIIITPMSFNGSSYILRRSNNTTTITDVKKIITSSDLSNYITNSNSYINTHPENNPVIIPFIHNDIAFLLKRGGSAKIYYDNVEQTLDISNVFDGSGSYWGIDPTGTTTIMIELTLHKVFTWTNTIYCDFGASGWRSKSVKIEVMNSNYTGDVWTSKYNTTSNASGNVKTQFTHTPVGADNAGKGFNKIRFTFSDWNNTTIFRIAQLGVYNYGSQGVRETYMSRGIDDAIYRNITPNNNNTFNLGSSSNKWANVYATNLNGNASTASLLKCIDSGSSTDASTWTNYTSDNKTVVWGQRFIKSAYSSDSGDISLSIEKVDNSTSRLNMSLDGKVVASSGFQGNLNGTATKATGDKNGDDITTTYYKASNPNGYTSNTGTITGITMNGTSKGTSGVVDLGTVATTDTKNTTGSTDTSSKIFLVGATSQAANPQTYSDNEVYATSGVLTTKSVQVGGTAATMQYNSTDKCIEFVFS